MEITSFQSLEANARRRHCRFRFFLGTQFTFCEFYYLKLSTRVRHKKFGLNRPTGCRAGVTQSLTHARIRKLKRAVYRSYSYSIVPRRIAIIFRRFLLHCSSTPATPFVISNYVLRQSRAGWGAQTGGRDISGHHFATRSSRATFLVSIDIRIVTRTR